MRLSIWSNRNWPETRFGNTIKSGLYDGCMLMPTLSTTLTWYKCWQCTIKAVIFTHNSNCTNSHLTKWFKFDQDNLRQENFKYLHSMQDGLSHQEFGKGGSWLRLLRCTVSWYSCYVPSRLQWYCCSCHPIMAAPPPLSHQTLGPGAWCDLGWHSTHLW